MKHFSRRATSADSGSECQRPGFLCLSPVRRLLSRQGESQGPPQNRCRMLGGLSCRENATLVDVLERLISLHNGGRGLERLNIVDTDSYTALDVAKVLRRIITAAKKNLNEMRAEAATVGDAGSASSGDNDTSDKDSELTQSHSSDLLFSLYIADKQVGQCHECYSKSNGTIPELCAAFKKSH